MKKLMFLVPFIVLLLSACSSESKENYTQMLGAFERNDKELNTMLNEQQKTLAVNRTGKSFKKYK
ncbi:hypothetical protein [Jeotgalicoccus sp. WY2]|uniref:hypothetical protein n=1 Tax=Jeotgalicoccus sp. WY2 TaxID=2708346 RepID=UPI001BD5C981|nr:hypothetical protein [Jeotgalicoccus sp. WY2]